MIPVPGLDSVRCAWVDIRAEGFTLHGFLVFLASDHYFPEYVEDEGLADLDSWTGNDCAVFIVQSPSATWIEYTRSTDHTWWRLFGHMVEEDEEVKHLLVQHGNTPVIQLNGGRRTLRELFAPCLNQFQHSAEIAKILHQFNLHPTDHPGLILFRELTDRKVWHVNMCDLVDLPVRDLRQALHRWFAGPEFPKLLKAARNA